MMDAYKEAMNDAVAYQEAHRQAERRVSELCADRQSYLAQIEALTLACDQQAGELDALRTLAQAVVDSVAGDVRERLAAYAHEAWSGWMRYLFTKATPNGDGTYTIPAWAVERWSRQMITPYDALPEEEQASDRTEADAMFAICRAALRARSLT